MELEYKRSKKDIKMQEFRHKHFNFNVLVKIVKK